MMHTVENMEKSGVSKTERAEVQHPESVFISYRPVSSYEKTAQRRLLLKADMVILPLTALIYFVAYLDRNSIGNARVLGMQKDLQLTDHRYFECLMMFYIGYIIFMPAGNVMLRTFGPSRQLGTATVIFGVLLCGMSVAENYATVLSLRILIGAVQAFIQGIGIYMSLWYARNELATRTASYYSAATLSGAFSGLIAYGVSKSLTVETTGRAPWRNLFIIEGVMAVGIGVITWGVLPAFPDKIMGSKHWLFNEAEINLAVERSTSYNSIHAKVNFGQARAMLLDPKSWAFAFMNAGSSLGIASLGNFLPTFINAFGYSPERTQLLSVIPYACAFIAVLSMGILSDRMDKKGPFLVFGYALSATGYVVLLVTTSPKAGLAGTCLVASGLYPCVILSLSWISINTAGYTKRALTWALAEIVGQSCSIASSYIYDKPPRFIKGHAIVLGFLAFSIVNAIAQMIWMHCLNCRKNREKEACIALHERHLHEEMSLEEVGDLHVSFKYIL